MNGKCGMGWEYAMNSMGTRSLGDGMSSIGGECNNPISYQLLVSDISCLQMGPFDSARPLS